MTDEKRRPTEETCGVCMGTWGRHDVGCERATAEAWNIHDEHGLHRGPFATYAAAAADLRGHKGERIVPVSASASLDDPHERAVAKVWRLMNGEGEPTPEVRKAVKAAIVAGVPFDDEARRASAKDVRAADRDRAIACLNEVDEEVSGFDKIACVARLIAATREDERRRASPQPPALAAQVRAVIESYATKKMSAIKALGRIGDLVEWGTSNASPRDLHYQNGYIDGYAHGARVEREKLATGSAQPDREMGNAIATLIEAARQRFNTWTRETYVALDDAFKRYDALRAAPCAGLSDPNVAAMEGIAAVSNACATCDAKVRNGTVMHETTCPRVSPNASADPDDYAEGYTDGVESVLAAQANERAAGSSSQEHGCAGPSCTVCATRDHDAVAPFTSPAKEKP